MSALGRIRPDPYRSGSNGIRRIDAFVFGMEQDRFQSFRSRRTGRRIRKRGNSAHPNNVDGENRFARIGNQTETVERRSSVQNRRGLIRRRRRNRRDFLRILQLVRILHVGQRFERDLDGKRDHQRHKKGQFELYQRKHHRFELGAGPAGLEIRNRPFDKNPLPCGRGFF